MKINLYMWPTMCGTYSCETALWTRDLFIPWNQIYQICQKRPEYVKVELYMRPTICGTYLCDRAIWTRFLSMWKEPKERDKRDLNICKQTCTWDLLYVKEFYTRDLCMWKHTLKRDFSHLYAKEPYETDWNGSVYYTGEKSPHISHIMCKKSPIT